MIIPFHHIQFRLSPTYVDCTNMRRYGKVIYNKVISLFAVLEDTEAEMLLQAY